MFSLIRSVFFFSIVGSYWSHRRSRNQGRIRLIGKSLPNKYCPEPNSNSSIMLFLKLNYSVYKLTIFIIRAIIILHSAHYLIDSMITAWGVNFHVLSIDKVFMYETVVSVSMARLCKDLWNLAIYRVRHACVCYKYFYKEEISGKRVKSK